MIGASIDLSGLSAFEAALRQAPDAARQAMLAATWEAELLLQREAQDRAPVGIGGGGGYRGSISARTPVISGLGISGEVGTAIPHAVFVELGTAPHMPPEQPIRDYVEHKLNLSGADADEATGKIRWKIYRKGTEGQFVFKRTTEENADQVRQIYARHGAALTRRLSGGRQ